MAKTYDVYIAENIYELLVYPNSGTQKRYIHLENMTGEQLRCLKAVANDGGMALAYTMNENDEDNYGPR